MPDGVFTMNLDLLERCWLVYQMTNQIPHPDFVQSLPVNYLNELAMFGQGVQFFEDYAKRPQEMR